LARGSVIAFLSINGFFNVCGYLPNLCVKLRRCVSFERAAPGKIIGSARIRSNVGPAGIFSASNCLKHPNRQTRLPDQIFPAIPEPVLFLEDLFTSLWWCWHHDAIELFGRVSPAFWQKSEINPVAFLTDVPRDRFVELCPVVGADEGRRTGWSV